MSVSQIGITRVDNGFIVQIESDIYSRNEGKRLVFNSLTALVMWLDRYYADAGD